MPSRRPLLRHLLSAALLLATWPTLASGQFPRPGRPVPGKQPDSTIIRVPVLTPASPTPPVAPPPPQAAPTKQVAPPPPSAPPPPPTTPILVGTGVADITGPIADVVMMGYAHSSQVAAGISQRLFARAYVFANPNGERVVFVSAELGQLFGGVKQGVMRKLAARYGGLYSDRNVMLTATHTHAGPGGYAHYAIFNFSTNGYNQQNYDAIVDGIATAIIRAHDTLAPASLGIGTGVVYNASINRSQVAFQVNRDAAGQQSENRDMTLMRIDRPTGPAGVISWFAVHNTSLSRENKYVSSDHKGYASYLFERAQGTIQPFQSPNGFVAAFANGEEGDQSPNINANFRGPGGDDEWQSMRLIGERTYGAADAIFRDSMTPVRGVIESRHSFVQMSGLPVATAERNGIGTNTLCSAAYGFSFATGSEDGRSGLPFVEGMRFDWPGLGTFATAVTLFQTVAVPPFARTAFNSSSNATSDACQRPKPILIATGALGWTPDILPFQLLRVGNVVIVGIPGEMTIQAGRRLRKAVQSIVSQLGVSHVILAGLANEYSGYITTPEEYDTQQYEGASTLYGRLTFEAYVQQYSTLATHLVNRTASAPGPTPRDLSALQQTMQTPVIFDNKRIWETFGQVFVQPPASVPRGATVSVTFRAGHPKNKLNTGWSHYFIERLTAGGGWASQVWDAMPEGRFTWRRDFAPDCVPLASCSFADVSWTVPLTAIPGTYRITHNGAWKNGLNGEIRPYEGATRNFEVR